MKNTNSLAIMLIVLLSIPFGNCYSKKKINYEGVVYTLNDIQLKVNVKTNAQKYPKTHISTTVPYWLSFSLTNLSETTLFEAYSMIDGKSQIASIYIVFRLSDNTLIEHREALIGVKVSPQMTSTEHSIVVWVAKNKNIVSVEGVRIEYSSTI
ncbi:hypothetical protein [Dysgonomonas sp. ZJ709]|uniref:hypothetical protein n=1 Tax=Dysgonomonas sp. ZJ709 TaxID=2709797 RepID=UPI0013ECB429|nr:hypothetical protein [Dysgonomonas sp. ZJ709]